MDDAQREAVGTVLDSLQIHPLESGTRPEFAFILIKTVDSAGDSSWLYRTTDSPNREELLGALQVQVDLLRRELADEWESE